MNHTTLQIICFHTISYDIHHVVYGDTSRNLLNIKFHKSNQNYWNMLLSYLMIEQKNSFQLQQYLRKKSNP
jgi:hypothetical protein